MVTKPLTPEEDRAWRTFLHASTQLLARLDEDMKESHGEPLATFDVLSNLSEAPGSELRMSELADQTLFSRSRLSYTVQRLEARGLVERKSDAIDGRGVIAKLTPEGVAYHRKLARTHLDGIRRHFLDPLADGPLSKLTASVSPILEAFER